MHSADEKTSPVELLKSVLTELTHALRTPVGIALNVVRDTNRGLAVEPEDLADAESALKKIVSILNILSPVLKYKGEKAVTVSGKDLALVLGEGGIQDVELDTNEKFEIQLRSALQLIEGLKERGYEVSFGRGLELKVVGELGGLEELVVKAVGQDCGIGISTSRD